MNLFVALLGKTTARTEKRVDLGVLLKYSEDQERDELGRFAGGGSVASTDANGYGVFDEATNSYAGVEDNDWMTWAHDSDNINEAVAGKLEAGQTSSSDGHSITAEEVAEYRNIGRGIQRAAEQNYVTGNFAVFRGESYDSMEEAKAKYGFRKEITHDRLTSTTPNLEAAKLYATSGGDDGRVKVLVAFQQKGGIQGIQTAPMGVPTNEVIMPKGASFRVTSVRVSGNVMVVEAYQKNAPSGKAVKDRFATGGSYNGTEGLLSAMGKVDLGGLLKGIDDSAHAAATSPTNDLSEPSSVKIKAGNYKKGHIKISGVNISIENPAGSYRRPEWPIMQAHYGYIRGTEGADGDAVDVFVRPATEEDWAGEVHVIHQLNAVGAHDEDKVMMGYDTKATAVSAYLAHYPKDWVLGPVTTYSFKQFKQWLKENAK